jgi:hypothetical protein
VTKCDDARDRAFEAKIAESAAKQKYEAAREQTARDKPGFFWNAATLIACAIGSGLLDTTVIAAPIGTALLTTCGTVQLHEVWEEHERYDEDQDRQSEAYRELGEARRRLAEAEKARAKECAKHKSHKCGELGGPGYRRPSGKCAAWNDGGHHTAYA